MSTENQGRKLLRPGEYTSQEAAVKNIEDGVRSVALSNSSYVRTKQEDPYEDEFEKISNLLLPAIKKLANNELSKEELEKEFKEAQKKQNKSIEDLLLKGKVECAKNPFKKAIKAQYDEIHDNHVEWYKRMRTHLVHGMNQGVPLMPHDAGQWSEAQKAALYEWKRIFQFIHDPKDFEQIDGYLADNCKDYRARTNSDNSNCPCIESCQFAEEYNASMKTLMTVTVGSNYWQLLEYLAEVAKKNAHMKYIIFRMMHRFYPDGKFVILRSKNWWNIFFELNMEYQSKSEDDDPSKTWKILETVEPYCNYMHFDSYKPRGEIRTNDNLQAAYWQNALSFMVAAGRYDEFLEKINSNPKLLKIEDLPQILVEVANSDSVELLEKTAEFLMKHFAVNTNYHSMSARHLLFPRKTMSPKSMYPRCSDSFIHVAIERGNVEYFGKLVTFLYDFYEKREETKRLNREYLEQKKADEGGLSEVDKATYETYWNNSENLPNDLEHIINAGKLNPLEYAIVCQENDMEKILLKIGMPDKESYFYLRKYVAFMHGDPQDFLTDITANMKEIYSKLSLIPFIPYVPVQGVQQILDFYAVHPEMCGERQQEDMTDALAGVLYPRAGCLVEPKLRNQDHIKNMKKIVAALLMAGAEFSSETSTIAEIPRTVPSEILELLDYVAEARSKYSYPPNQQPVVETADESVYEFFKH